MTVIKENDCFTVQQMLNANMKNITMKDSFKKDNNSVSFTDQSFPEVYIIEKRFKLIKKKFMSRVYAL